MRLVTVVGTLSLGLLLTSRADAQTSSDDLARTNGAQVSDTVDALPGVHRVGIAGLRAVRATGAAQVNYGYTEPQNGADNAHHRIGGSLAAGVAPWSFAAAAVRVDVRHDMHGESTDGPDSGTTMDVTPHLRFGGSVGSGLHLGADLRGIFYGAASNGSLAPPSLDARALASYLALKDWVFALHAGYRLGVSDQVATDAMALRPGDRITMGLSEFDALLLGLGATRSFGRTEVLAEVTWDLLLGAGAPPVSESPLRVAVGVRQELTPGLRLQGLLEALPLSRAPSTQADPLVPIEPRVQAQLGLIFRFLDPYKRKAPPPVVKEEPKPAPPPPPVEAEPTPKFSSARITVVDETGHPISDARVTLIFPASDKAEAQTLAVPLVSENVYELGDVPVGEATLQISADLLTDHSQTVVISDAQPFTADVELKKASNIKAQLRGLVRAFSGEGLTAKIKVSPGDQETTCDAEGNFVIDLAPGKYTVTISADGYRPQTRTLTVRKEGVTVLNADLQAGKN